MLREEIIFIEGDRETKKLESIFNGLFILFHSTIILTLELCTSSQHFNCKWTSLKQLNALKLQFFDLFCFILNLLQMAYVSLL